MNSKNSNKQKETDITKVGSMNYRQLQDLNNLSDEGLSQDFLDFIGSLNQPVSQYDARLHAQRDISSPLMQQETPTGGQDYWGNSIYDDNTATEEQFRNLSDIRAENQPWYSKVLNGQYKAGVLAITTALETVGLLYGLGQGTYNAANAEDGKKGSAFLHGLWDNPITNALQKVNEYSEEYMPNYYTRDEQENPWHNIFTANFLGDKLIKNFGFMVGAFYGGIPLATGIGKIGTSAVKGARAANLARSAGMAARASEITSGYADDVIKQAAKYGKEIVGKTADDAASIASKYSDDAIGLHKKLAAEGLTEAEIGQVYREGLSEITNIAKTTRATSQTLGALSSAINEGAIEAINNSKDWAKLRTREADNNYQKEIEEIDALYGNSPIGINEKLKAAKKHEAEIAAIEEGRASMGNADLLLNLPILLASNMFQLGKLYTRGFDSTRRQLGSFWNGHKLSGSLAKGTLGTDRTMTKAIISSLLKSNTEGMEEYLQRAASDGAGNAVNESIDRYLNSGKSEDSKTNVDNFIVGFGKAIADNFNDPHAWEEYFIGAVSSLVGMPVFGSQTKNAYMKFGPIGFAGGFVGNYQDYMKAKEKEELIAKHLNERVKDPKFKELYEQLRFHDDYEALLSDALLDKDKREYKDLDFELVFKDINAAASSGHLEEFKELIGFNKEYTDEELKDILKNTTRIITADEQRTEDTIRLQYLEKQAARLQEAAESLGLTSSMKSDLESYRKEADMLSEKLRNHDYKDKYEGPFIDANGQMDDKNPDKMREILERNKLKLLETIDNYLKIRNEIDIETDGALSDKHIEFLTMLKGHILDLDIRSAEMAYDLISTLKNVQQDGDIIARYNLLKEVREKQVKSAEETLKKANDTLEEAKKANNKKAIKNAESDKEDAEKMLNHAKGELNKLNSGLQLLELLTKEVPATAKERDAFEKGYNKSLESKRNRNINSDEAQNMLSYPENAKALIGIINSGISNLDAATRERLENEVGDLFYIGYRKREYNRKREEFLDPKKFNEIVQEKQTKITQQQIESKAEELADRIRNVKSMEELDKILREARTINGVIAEKAIQIAKEKGNEDIKKLIDDYQQGYGFYTNFNRLAARLTNDEIKGMLSTAASGEWDNAVMTGINSKQVFIDGMMIIANDSRTSEFVSKEIKRILQDLEAISNETATNEKKPKSSKSKSTSEPTLEQRKAAAAESMTRKQANTDTIETLKKDITDAIIDIGVEHFNGMKSLPEKLQERIKKYNDSQENDSAKITDGTILGYVDSLVDAEILAANARDANREELDNASEEQPLDYLDVDHESSEVAAEMKAELKVSFRSDRVTAYDMRNKNFKEPYTAADRPSEREQLMAIQKLLTELKAYDFLDKNYLGYILSEIDSSDLPLYFFKSTDSAVDGNGTSESAIFVGIEWTPEVERAIRKHSLNGDTKTPLEINLQEIKDAKNNTHQYQILGVVTFTESSDRAVKDAFSGFQQAICREINPKLQEARDNNQKFVKSDKLTSVIRNVYTGRLEKQNNADDISNRNVSLYTFMRDSQGVDGRKTSSEWDSGMEFYFATVINHSFTIHEDLSGSGVEMQEPNPTWVGKNNGAVLLYLPKANGKYYPVRCTRRTVKNWLSSEDNIFNLTGQQILMKLIADKKADNEYLRNIIDLLSDLYDANKPLGTRMKAKQLLSRYFIFGKTSPIHFSDSVWLNFGKKEEDKIPLDGSNYSDTSELLNGIPEDKRDFAKFVLSFFDALEANNIMFTIPSSSMIRIGGRSIIESGVLEINLRGFYNYNSNFSIRPIDGNGKMVTISVDEKAEQQNISGNMRGTEWEVIIEGKKETYFIAEDGTAYTKDKKEKVSPEIQNYINILKNTKDNKYPSLTNMILSEESNPEVVKILSNAIGNMYHNVYVIKGPTDKDPIYICTLKNGGKSCSVRKMTTRFDEDKMVKDIRNAILKARQKHAAELLSLTKNNSSFKVGDIITNVPFHEGRVYRVTSTADNDFYTIVDIENNAEIDIKKSVIDGKATITTAVSENIITNKNGVKIPLGEPIKVTLYSGVTGYSRNSEHDAVPSNERIVFKMDDGTGSIIEVNIDDIAKVEIIVTTFDNKEAYVPYSDAYSNAYKYFIENYESFSLDRLKKEIKDLEGAEGPFIEERKKAINFLIAKKSANTPNTSTGKRFSGKSLDNVDDFNVNDLNPYSLEAILIGMLGTTKSNVALSVFIALQKAEDGGKIIDDKIEKEVIARITNIRDMKTSSLKDIKKVKEETEKLVDFLTCKI